VLYHNYITHSYYQPSSGILARHWYY